MSRRPKIHLVSYATPQFRHRQIILGLSARLNKVVDTVTAWTTERLKSEGFAERIPDIGLDERGSGFWSWKPFIIQKRLKEVTDGDIVFYCDVGRIYPFKLLDQSVASYLRWMEESRQDVMPGIEIPWNGPMIRWTKRDALVAMDMDTPQIHVAAPIQASFSIWRVSPYSRALVSEWLELCRQRQLVSDDPSVTPGGEHGDFQENRHDQALLSLLCMKKGVKGLSLGPRRPGYDFRNPSRVSEFLFGDQVGRAGWGFLRAALAPLEVLERCLRPSSKIIP
jgi:hypothetical protein